MDRDVELKVLRLPIATGIVLSALALVSAPITGSQAILLDGFFSLTYLITGLFTYSVAKLLRKGVSRRFPFGYTSLEPLVNLIKGLLIAGIGMLSLWYAGVSVFNGGSSIEAGGAVVYAIANAFVTTGMAMYVWIRYRRSSSPLVKGDIAARQVDAITALGALIGFIVAYVLYTAGYHTAARYVDPVLTIALVLVTVGVPYSLGKSALSELVLIAPKNSQVSTLEDKVRNIFSDLHLKSLDVRAVKIGRVWEVVIHAQLEHNACLDVRQTDIYRGRLIDEFEDDPRDVQVYVIFTYMELD